MDHLTSFTARSLRYDTVLLVACLVAQFFGVFSLRALAPDAASTVTYPDPSGNPPYVGTLIHTVYFSPTAPAWKWYWASSSFAATRKMPTLGFYDQTVGTAIQEAHYQQLREAKSEFALFSWYGDQGQEQSENGGSDRVFRSYWKVFTEENKASTEPPIRLLVLMEFGETNSRQRIDYLKANFYDKNPDEILHYQGKPILAIGFNGFKPDVDGPIVQYAESEGFYVAKGPDPGVGSFIGISFKPDDPRRISPLFAGCCPGGDVSGKNVILPAVKLTVGAGRVVQDGGSAGGNAVQSTGTGTIVSTTLAGPQIYKKKARYGEAHAIFRLKTRDLKAVQGTISVTDDAGNTYRLPINAHSFSSNDTYANLILEFPRPGEGPLTLRVNLTAGEVAVDHIWLTSALFLPLTLAQYDSQWEVIEKLPPAQRPLFICVASLNCWEENTVLEANNVDGTKFLDRTAYWAQRLKQEEREGQARSKECQTTGRIQGRRVPVLFYNAHDFHQCSMQDY